MPLRTAVWRAPVTSICLLVGPLLLGACGSGSEAVPGPPVKYRLLILPVESSTGAGHITGGGIDCTTDGTSTSGTCSVPLDEGTSVTLAATPVGEAAFNAWGGDCSGSATCTVVLSTNRTATVRFVTAFSVGVSAEVGSNGTGTITSIPGGINCVLTAGVATGTCLTAFPEDVSMTLVASPAAGSSFLGWGSAAPCDMDLTCIVLLPNSRSVTAKFGLLGP